MREEGRRVLAFFIKLSYKQVFELSNPTGSLSNFDVYVNLKKHSAHDILTSDRGFYGHTERTATIMYKYKDSPFGTRLSFSSKRERREGVRAYYYQVPRSFDYGFLITKFAGGFFFFFSYRLWTRLGS